MTREEYKKLICPLCIHRNSCIEDIVETRNNPESEVIRECICISCKNYRREGMNGERNKI